MSICQQGFSPGVEQRPSSYFFSSKVRVRDDLEHPIADPLLVARCMKSVEHDTLESEFSLQLQEVIADEQSRRVAVPIMKYRLMPSRGG